MKRLFLFLILTLAVVMAAIAFSPNTQQRTAASLAGVWKGDFPNTNVPAVELSLQMESDQPAGRVIFYQVVRSEAGTEVKGKAEKPLDDLSFDGKLLSFKARRDDGSFYQGRVRFVAEHEAVLLSDEQTSVDAPAILLRRVQ